MEIVVHSFGDSTNRSCIWTVELRDERVDKIEDNKGKFNNQIQ